MPAYNYRTRGGFVYFGDRCCVSSGSLVSLVCPRPRPGGLCTLAHCCGRARVIGRCCSHKSRRRRRATARAVPGRRRARGPRGSPNAVMTRSREGTPAAHAAGRGSRGPATHRAGAAWRGHDDGAADLCNMLCIPKYENRNSRSRNPHTRRRTPTTAARPPRRRPRRRHGRRVGRKATKPGGPNVWILSFSLTGGLELVSNIADRVPLSACKCKMVSKFDGLTTCKYASITSPSRGRYAEPLRVRTVCAYRGKYLCPAVIPRSPKANFPKNAGSKRGHVSDTHLFARALSDAPVNSGGPPGKCGNERAPGPSIARYVPSTSRSADRAGRGSPRIIGAAIWPLD